MINIQDELIKIIAKIVNPTEDLFPHTNLQDAGMTSITFINIVVEIENCFDIEFPDEKLIITEANTVNDLYEIIIEQKNYLNQYTKE
ncbi:MAG: acyl carrier protein [Bacilli bacterium]